MSAPTTPDLLAVDRAAQDLDPGRERLPRLSTWEVVRTL